MHVIVKKIKKNIPTFVCSGIDARHSCIISESLCCFDKNVFFIYNLETFKKKFKIWLMPIDFLFSTAYMEIFK